MVYAYQIKPKRKRNLFLDLNMNNTLILINVVSFIIFAVMLSTKMIPIDYIALKPANILQGKYIWTFLTSMFMHGGIFHLFVNMLSLFFVGGLIEKILGKKRYLSFYLISGLFAGLFFVLSSLVFSADFNAYAVGSSGAIFGLIGLMMFLTPNLRVYVMFVPIPIKMKYAGLGMLILLWAISIAGSIPIGNTAHLGGFLAGLVYGFYLKKKFPNKTKMINQTFS